MYICNNLDFFAYIQIIAHIHKICLCICKLFYMFKLFYVYAFHMYKHAMFTKFAHMQVSMYKLCIYAELLYVQNLHMYKLFYIYILCICTNLHMCKTCTHVSNVYKLCIYAELLYVQNLHMCKVAICSKLAHMQSWYMYKTCTCACYFIYIICICTNLHMCKTCPHVSFMYINFAYM